MDRVVIVTDCFELIWSQAPKRARNGGGIKREDKGGGDRHKHKKKKSF